MEIIAVRGGVGQGRHRDLRQWTEDPRSMPAAWITTTVMDKIPGGVDCRAKAIRRLIDVTGTYATVPGGLIATQFLGGADRTACSIRES
jgi:hypothetical protein